MRREITRRSDLATRAMVELNRLGRRTKSVELAEAIGTTPGFLSQAMTPLAAKAVSYTHLTLPTSDLV